MGIIAEVLQGHRNKISSKINDTNIILGQTMLLVTIQK